IGSVLTEHLLNQGCEVTCLDNLMYRQASLLHLANKPGFNFVFGDTRDKGLMGKLVPQFDVIVPLAAIVGEGACNARMFEATTTNRDAVVMINELRSSDQKLVLPNTNSGYGRTTGDVFCTEETPLSPIGHYGQTKVEAERAILRSDKKGLTLRLATVFGVSPRMRTDLLVNDFVKRAMTDRYLALFEGQFMRNYVHIQDVARAFEHALRRYGEMSGAYNVGLDEANMSKLDLAKRIAEHLPGTAIREDLEGKDTDQRNYIVSNEKLKGTGFVFQHSLDDGIQELIKAYTILLRLDPSKNS
ncbi:MAG: SDR family oxidoreductase, partial [Nanoarchaeota archaeon]